MKPKRNSSMQKQLDWEAQKKEAFWVPEFNKRSVRLVTRPVNSKKYATEIIGRVYQEHVIVVTKLLCPTTSPTKKHWRRVLLVGMIVMDKYLISIAEIAKEVSDESAKNKFFLRWCASCMHFQLGNDWWTFFFFALGNTDWKTLMDKLSSQSNFSTTLTDLLNSW